ncbi:sigma-E processing peptidase SpoIIGA [Romboutsia sp.]|uniref:sigma-E processing peptidase SpoIIGA n=1 Tax=Romboutsia sp. TaxID=1965302 RepID=UPI003F39DFA2
MYMDYYIIENLLINYIIISCTSILTKKYNSSKKKWIGALLGTAYSVAYVFPNLAILFTLPSKIIIMTIITLISFTYKNLREYISIVITFFLVNVFICGSTYFVIYFTGISHIKISFIIVCSYVSCELLKYIYRDIKMLNYLKSMKKTIRISLLSNSFECEALVDSGNLLKDPVGNNEVVIVKSSVLKGLIPEELLNYDYENINYDKVQEIIDLLDKDLSSRVRMIPYKHAGSSQSNMILGLKADYIEIDKNKIGNIVLGISNFDDYEYSAILNPSILQ